MLNDLMPVIVDLPLEDTTIIPIGDVHVGSREMDTKGFESFLESIKGTNKKIIITGDMIDNGIKSSVSSTYEQTMMPAAQKEYLYEKFLPIKDNIIAAVGGNHEARSRRDSDDNPLYDVMCRLHQEDVYRERMAFVIVRLGHDKKGKVHSTPTYSIVLTHGTGNGMYIGSSSSRAERFSMSIDGCDIFVMGHTHKPQNYPVAKLKIDAMNKAVVQKQYTVVVATSWLTPGGYGLGKMFTPTAIKPQEIYLSSKQKEVRVLQ